MKPSNREQWKTASDNDFTGDHLEFKQAINFNFKDFKNMKVLDYGCGAGKMGMEFARHGAKVTCADIVKENIEVARSNFQSAKLQGDFIYLEDSDAIPKGNEYFDIVWCFGVLHHIENVEPVIQELKRVLKKGGIIYVMLYTEFLIEKTLNEMIKNNIYPWNMGFGFITDKCDYSRFYSADKVYITFKDFKMLEYGLFHNRQFRIYKLRRIR